MVEMIIRHSYPFRIVKHEGFIKFVNGLQPKYKVVSEQTVHRDCIEIAEELKEKAYAMVSNAPGRLNYTTDMWTSNQTLGYMVVTCHFININ